jgi:benzoyl-CoA 2,3-dioxygenase component B
VRRLGGIDLPTIQKFINLWFSLSLDLHGNEISTNAASYFANGLKGGRRKRSGTTTGRPSVLRARVRPTAARRKAIPMRTAMNEVLRDWYVGDCAGRRRALEHDLRAPRHVGSAAPARSQVQPRHRHVLVAALRSAGAPLSDEEWDARSTNGCRRRRPRIPPQHHGEPVYEPGKFANYIAPPLAGVNRHAD